MKKKKFDPEKAIREHQKKATAILENLDIPPGEYIIFLDSEGNGVRVADMNGNVIKELDRNAS